MCKQLMLLLLDLILCVFLCYTTVSGNQLQNKETALSKIGQLFEQTTIQYVFSNSSEENDTFNSFIAHMSYSPLLLEFIPGWYINRGRYNLDKLEQQNKTIFQKMRFSFTNQVLLLIDFQSIEQSRIANTAALLFQRIVLVNENPHYALFLMRTMDEFEGKVIDLIKYCSASAKLLFISGSFPNAIYTVCLTCHPSSQFKDVSWALTTQHIDSEWSLQNKNFHAHSIFIFDGFKVNNNFEQVCGYSVAEFTLNAESCIPAFLLLHHNATETTQFYSHESKVVLSVINSKFMPQKEDVEFAFLKQVYDRYIWEPHKTKKYEFMIVAPKPSNLKKFSALVEPLDWLTWAGMALTCFAVVILLSLEERFKIKWKYLWTCLSVFLYQGNAIFTEKQNHFSRLCWGGCFLFLGLFLGIFYQGELACSITTLLPPIVPTRLSQLSNSGLQIITQTATFQPEHPWTSTFLRMVEIYFQSSTTNNQSYDLLLQKISRNTRWVGYSSPQIAQNVSFGLPIYDMEGKEVQFGHLRTLAYWDDNDSNDIFEAVINYYGELIVVRNRETFPFDISMPMLVRKNFLQPILSKTFKQLVNTGFVVKWDSLHFRDVITVSVKAQFKNKSRSYILGRQEANSKFSKANNNISSVTLESMKYFFFVFGLLLSLALVVGLIELCIRQNRIRSNAHKNGKINQCCCIKYIGRARKLC